MLSWTTVNYENEQQQYSNSKNIKYNSFKSLITIEQFYNSPEI